MDFLIKLVSVEYNDVRTPCNTYRNHALSGWVYTFKTHTGEASILIEENINIECPVERVALAAKLCVSQITTESP